MTTKTSIWITTSFEGMHKWPKAPALVAFLRNLHRHKFNVKVGLAVNHDDRDVEFFMFKWEADRIIKEELLPLLAANPQMSCEMMAKYLLDTFSDQQYPVLYVEVDEDGENGARAEIVQH